MNPFFPTINTRRRRITVLLAIAASLCFSSTKLLADDVPLGDPTTPVTLPAPSSDAYGISVAFGPSNGLMYVWDGSHVLKQTAFNSTSYTSIATVNTSGSDAGPIAFSSDASTILLGNGAGGTNPDGNTGLIFSVPSTGGTASSPVGSIDFHNAFLAAPISGSNSKFFVDTGNEFFSGSTVSVFDSSNGSNSLIINNIPGASTSMAMDSSGRLYVGVGFGDEVGELRRFSMTNLVNAYNTHTPVDWTSGELFNSSPNNSGAGMFFDAAGRLFVGWSDGVTVFTTHGNSRVFDNEGYTTVTYDPLDDRVLVTGFGNEQGIYNASSFVVPQWQPGDFNLDGHVDARDIQSMESALTNLNGYQHGGNSLDVTLNNTDLLGIGDLNGDGQITNADLQFLLNSLKSGGGSFAVPEPSSWLLAISAAAAGCWLRRRDGQRSRAVAVVLA
jgi:hypothetical protein